MKIKCFKDLITFEAENEFDCFTLGQIVANDKWRFYNLSLNGKDTWIFVEIDKDILLKILTNEKFGGTTLGSLRSPECNQKKNGERGSKRFWVFGSIEYECGIGMQDYVGSFDKELDAQEEAKKYEWAAVFDSLNFTQENYRYGKIYVPKKFGDAPD